MFKNDAVRIDTCNVWRKAKMIVPFLIRFLQFRAAAFDIK